ncbi:MAG TPA: methionyl-tRNA formyltransferase [Candidatus Saccharimonadales bacterium]|nr:methionyl-tRNA formyltransferase [Candidatus Saccharimonadales bacterium]
MSKTIVFFGSGPVAAKSLVLLAKNFVIEAVVSKPRAPHHKGDVPVLRVAEALGLPVKTATDKQSLDALFTQKPFKSELAVLVDFGIIVSQEVIDYFPLGIVNSHFSLLPEWRGADPITFSILSGQQRTGVSLMLLSAGMDEGSLLAQTPCAIDNAMTTPELTDELIELSDQTLQTILPLWAEGKVQAAPQSEVTLAPSVIPTYSRKLTKEDGIIDWNKDAATLEREIRAFAEWPKSHATFGSLAVIITKAHVLETTGQTPGTTTIENKLPVVFCGTNALAIDRIKPAGKQEMTGESFLAGYKQLFLTR